jgi:hypothetical protein
VALARTRRRLTDPARLGDSSAPGFPPFPRDIE